MSIGARERSLLAALFGAEGKLPMHTLARETGINARTVRRCLVALDRWLATFDLRLEKTAGAGIRIVGTPAQLARARREIEHLPAADVRPARRQDWMLARVLASADVTKLHALAADLDVTVATAARDLQAIEAWLADRGIRIVRKRGYGIATEATEENRRRAIADFVLEHTTEPRLARLLAPAETSHTPPAEASPHDPIFLLIPPESFHRAATALRELESETAPRFTAGALAEIGIQLAVAATRATKSPLANAAAAQLAARPDADTALAERLLARVLKGNEPQRAEIAQIALQVRGAKRRQPVASTAVADQRGLARGVRALVAACDRQLGTQLVADETLLAGLRSHLETTLYRLAHRMPIRNALLAEVKREYAALFALLDSAARDAFPRTPLPKEEIGFLVMHVGAALERQRRRCRVLVVCAAGIGTSRMLASRLRSECPDLEIVDELSWFEAEQRNQDDYDAILATIPLPPGAREHLVVHPLLPAADLARVRELLRRHRAAALAPRSHSQPAPCP